MDKINLINEIVKEDSLIEYRLNLVDDLNDEVVIMETDGELDDDGYADYNLNGIANREAIEAKIAKRWGVEYEEGVMFTLSNTPQDFRNLLQAMLQCFAYAEFERQGWIK